MVSGTTVRSRLVRLAAVGLAGLFAISGASALAVHENVEFPVTIHAGSCEAPGDVVFAFDNLVRLPEGAPAEGERVGAANAQVVHGLDEAEIDLSLDELLAADHIVAVFNAAGDTIVACGPIGAYTYNDGDDLAIGLREQGDSNFSGVALFDGDDDDEDDEVDVEIYLVSSAMPPAATDEDATPAATPVA